uniref:Coenzyme Q-binding protein COQ10 START domain-containing protein n=1 Tax=Araucaria cunninghamii TaxID=56994 RepID=A0A0D6QWB4_ARACU
MRPFSEMSKAAFRLASCRRQRAGVQIGLLLGRDEVISRNGDLHGHRELYSIARANSRGVVKKKDLTDEGILRRDVSVARIGAQQTRSFLGCGDGDEDCGLTKTYKEKRVVGYSPEQLFAVVAAVDLYEDFVPWCQRSTVLWRKNDEAFDAELQIGFKFLVERYISHVELKKPHYVKSTASDSNLFEYLINIWEFNNGPIPGTCDLHFFVDFQFRSPLYRQVADMFFKEVVSRLVGSFEQRCHTVYGPAVKVLEDAYGSQRV